jgi:hypothetical protein
MMSGSAKKRREKERQWIRRCTKRNRYRSKLSVAAIAALNQWLGVPQSRTKVYDIRRVEPKPIRDVEFAAFTDPTRHMYAGG